ncbi:MAG: ZIP family metal transporter [Gemmatimonadales bacterium]
MHVTPSILVGAMSQTVAAGPASLATALAFAALTAAGMLAGVWAIRRFEPWAIRHTAELIVFAAGLLVSGALLHLIPGSVELVGSGQALAWTLASFLVFYLLEAHFIPHVHARGESPIEDHQHAHSHDSHVGAMVISGLGIHSVADGLAVGASLSAGALLGSVAVLLVVVHKLPVGMAAMSALYHSGVPGRRASLITAALAFVTPAVVVVSYFTFKNVSEGFLGVLLALAGGSFLYIGAADLLPEGQAKGRPANTFMFFLGALIMIVIRLTSH